MQIIYIAVFSSPFVNLAMIAFIATGIVALIKYFKRVFF